MAWIWEHWLATVVIGLGIISWLIAFVIWSAGRLASRDDALLEKTKINGKPK